MPTEIFSLDFSSLEYAGKAGFIEGYPNLHFSNSKFPPHPKLPTQITVDSVIHEGDISSVYGANAENGQILHLAVKVGPARDLAQEADVYDLFVLKSLVGKSVPAFYGMLFSTIEKRGLACLITELFGSSLDREFYELPKAHKCIILSKLADIHAVGIVHTDFEPYNVLEKDGDFRIIDFGRFKSGHRCRQPRDLEFVAVGEDLSEDEVDKFCSNLYTIANDEMRLWERGRLYLLDSDYVEKGHGLPEQHMVYKFPPPSDHRGQLRWKVKYYQELQRQLLGGIRVEDLGEKENVAQRVTAATQSLESTTP
ncbi:hypothetical protein C8J56DRAFT_486093 [Mycena floridula]|nr:hypothetical protein C8J56DRAFT_486093 [Mycena floridula]